MNGSCCEEQLGEGRVNNVLNIRDVPDCSLRCAIQLSVTFSPVSLPNINHSFALALQFIGAVRLQVGDISSYHGINPHFPNPSLPT